MFSVESHPSMMSHRLMKLTSKFPRFVVTDYPPFDEEYFEWIGVLEAVASAREEFTMIELGAGWGRWLVNAATAIRRLTSFPCHLVGVEAEPTHFQWMASYFRENGIDPGAYELIQAAISDEDGEAWFYTGRPAKWYGQTLARGPDPKIGWQSAPGWVGVQKVHTVSLNRLLGRYERVDLIDADIQGAELKVFASARELLNQKVRSVCIMTHEPPEVIEPGLRALFHSLMWENVYDYSCGSKNDTPWGIIAFRDGVQRWINPRLW